MANIVASNHKIIRRLLLLVLAVIATGSHVLAANETVWTSTGPFGGEIRAIVIDPLDPDAIYIATYGNGVFKTTDRGASWTMINNGLTNLNVVALAIDDVASGTMYAATFGGLFRSTNAGASWQAANTGLSSLTVRTVQIDPRDSSRVYLGTQSGAFVSTNSGDSWTQLDPGFSEIIYALAIHPSDTNILYAGTGMGVYKSTNGGDTWASANTG